MKKNPVFFLFAAFAAVSCGDFLNPVRNGELTVRFDPSAAALTRVGYGIPDTDDFILTLCGQDGTEHYSGRFGDSPETFSLPSGSYTVSAVSCEFREPRYDSPQYGDTRVVLVPGGGSVTAELVCGQLNCGLRLNVTDGFRKTFPEASLSVKSDEGDLAFGYSETRTAFFRPGAVSLYMDSAGKEELLFSRILEAREILSVNLCVNPDGDASGGISVQVDTACDRSSEDYVYGGGGGSAEAEALSVPEAIENGEADGVWVYGYIAGSFSSSSRLECEPPFSKATNIVISSRTSATDKTKCISVELKSGALRDELNLVSHPENLGRSVCLHGDIVSSYYGITGLKNLSGYGWR